MVHTIKAIMLFVLITLSVYGQGATGTLEGRVTNSVNGEAIPGVAVIVMKSNKGVGSGMNGDYIVEKIPAGIYVIEFSMVGFETSIRSDVLIKPGRITILDVTLREQIMQTGNITVTSGYFNNGELQGAGSVNFNSEEIRRSPGAMGDVSRIVMALPSTAKVSDDNNDLMVRGGSPAENGFYIDGIPVPNINHFPSIGSSGGPIGILNVDYLDDIGFMAGTFPASFGDRLSSIVAVKYRDGNREEYTGKIAVDWSGFGGGMEGPLPGKSGSWLASFRRSYLDLFGKAEDWGMNIRYGDAQAKFSYDLGKKHKVSILTLYAYDNESFGRKDALDQGSVYYGSINNYQTTTGAQWRALWSNDFYSTTILSLSVQSFKDDFDNVNGGDKYYISDNLEKTISLRNANYYEINKENKVEAGIEGKWMTGNYDFIKYAWVDRLGNTEPDYRVRRSLYPSQMSIYASYLYTPNDILSIAAGARIDKYIPSNKCPVSPRIKITGHITDVSDIRLSGTVQYQQLPMVLLAGKPEFASLPEAKALQVGLGYDYLFSPDLKLSLDAYMKEYTQLPLTSDDSTMCVLDGSITGNSLAQFREIISTGKGYSRGIELLLQKKMSDSYYGILSTSYFRSKYQDLTGTWRNRIYDNRFTFSVIAGYKPNQEWEMSVRWTFAGGCPYTPIDKEKSVTLQSAVYDESSVNTARYPNYHSLNIRVDKKFFFGTQDIDIYLSVWNTYNKKNISSYYWNVDEQAVKPIYQWEVMPIFGVLWEM